jgi:hypothetical protein
MDIKAMAESVTLGDLLGIASPTTLAGIITDIDRNGHRGATADMIRIVCWRELVNNIGASDALEMVAK